MINLIHGDCLERMKDIPDGSVDLILTDPPYGTTACKWDNVIDFELMWDQLKRIIKPNGAIVLFGSQPYTSALISSNYNMFKYEWIWNKTKALNFQQAKNAPLKRHENVLVFSHGVVGHKTQTPKRMEYNPIGITSCEKFIRRNISNDDPHTTQRDNGIIKGYQQSQENYSDTMLVYGSVHNPPHPTQKPVALMEYLIETYTTKGEVVLDFTMGSGTTGVAAKNLNRDFIGIEMDETYFKIAEERISKASVPVKLMGIQTAETKLMDFK